MFNMKGNLIFPTILGIVAIVLAVAALLAPNNSNFWIWGVIAGLFGIYVLSGVLVSWKRRS